MLDKASHGQSTEAPTSPPWDPGGQSWEGESREGEPGQVRGSQACVCFWRAQGALRKIITTLAVKNEEIQSFIYSLKRMLLNVEVRKVPPPAGRAGAARGRASRFTPRASVFASGQGVCLTPGVLCQANSAKVQGDLEAEFQSLFSLLEELKENMLMKIKQDRASRTYELQVGQLASASPSKQAPPSVP